MLISMYYLQDSVTRLKNVAKTIEADLEKEEPKLNYTTVQGNVLQAFMDYKAAIEEAVWLLGEPDMHLVMTNKMLPMLEHSLLNANTLELLRDAIISLVTPFNDYDRYYIYESYDCYRTLSSRDNNEGFSREYMQQIMSNINSMTRPLKVLNPFARDGRNMLELTSLYERPLELYAIDVDGDIRSEDKSKFYRIALGDLKGSTISNDVFDIVMISPPLSFMKKGKNFIEKIERDYLQKSMNYLRNGGLLLYAIPVTHLYREICQYLAKNLTEVQIRMDGRRVYISGYRNIDKDRQVDRDIHLKLRTMMLYRQNDEFDLKKNSFGTIHIPTAGLPVKMFRGSKLDEEEFNTMFENSNATAMFKKDQNVEKLSENTKTPLLPFNVGQLGLILTSGCLDGVVDEGDGYFHAVKGRVVKKRDTQHEISAEHEKIDITEIVSNRVEINAFLPDGTYKCLA